MDSESRFLRRYTFERDSESRPLRVMNWEKFFFSDSKKRTELLMGFTNCGSPTDWDIVADLIKQASGFYFRKGFLFQNNGKDAHKAWEKYWFVQTKLYDLKQNTLPPLQIESNTIQGKRETSAESERK